MNDQNGDEKRLVYSLGDGIQWPGMALGMEKK